MLAAWADSPTRFREDANAEEDLRLGGYADTWCVELAQNAADAARAAGVPGRLRIAVEDGELRVANTGAPLDAAGVSALAALRASAKRDDAGSVGRFGVGFAAVLALSDAPRVVTVHGGVAFSAAATADAVRELPGPAAELARRDGQLPVLRLVWPTGADELPPPDGYATEVRLPLRPGLDPDALLAAATAAAPDLLLALPDLVEITVGGVRFEATVPPERSTNGRTVVEIGGPNGTARRWLLIARAPRTARGGHRHRASRAGTCGRSAGPCRWTPTAVRPRSVDDVLHAPTATAERLGLPARLIADVPLDPDRRRVRAGDATDAVLRAAADAYLDLVAAVAPDARLALVPAAGFPRSELDARLRELLLDVLRDAAWLPGAAGADVAPRAATVLDLPAPELPALLADVLPGLLAPIRRAPVRQEGHLQVAASERGFPDNPARRRPCSPSWACTGWAPPSWPTGCSACGGRPPGGGRCTRRSSRPPTPCRGCATSCAPCPSRSPTAARCPGPRACSSRWAPTPGWATSRCPACTSSIPTPCTRCCSGWAPRSRSRTGCSTTGRCATPSTVRWTTPRPGWTRCRWPRRCSGWWPSWAPAPRRPASGWRPSRSPTSTASRPARTS